MVARKTRALLRRRLKGSPAVALVGARQAGKTTLARSLSNRYFDLEQPGDRTRLDVEWDAVCAGKQLVILDEAQAWPEVFPRLRGAIDAERKRNGRFLLLGSVSPALMTQVSQSLAGRLALVELTPLLLSEMPSPNIKRHWLVGGYPDGGVLGSRSFPHWQNDYLNLIAQRDLPNWGLPAKPQTVMRLLKMCAIAHGQIWNASRIGQSLGLSHTTVRSYLDYLEGAFLTRLLPPYTPNLGKRLVRSPKLYWRDSGLLHALCGVTSRDDLLVQPWVGASWEGYVIEQILSALAANGSSYDPYFFRTSDGSELDLVLDLGSERWVFEVKLSSQPHPRDLERLRKLGDLLGARRRFLVSQTSRSAISDDLSSANLADTLTELNAGHRR